MKTILILAALAIVILFAADDEARDYLRALSSKSQHAAASAFAANDETAEQAVIKRWQNAPGFFTRKIKVQDGDSLIAPGNKHIRLLCIDAPEMDQQYGQEAKAFLQSIVKNGAEIRIKGTDKYGRSLAVVIIDIDGKKTIANYEMIRWGYAWLYRRFSQTCGLPEATMRIMEHQALKTKKGLWKTQSPTPPWRHRTQTPK